MRSDVSEPDEICGNINDSIDELLTSVDAMRWTPTPPGADPADPARATSSGGFEPTELKDRFDALYETIEAFAGAVDERLHTWSAKVEAAFAEDPATPTKSTGDD